MASIKIICDTDVMIDYLDMNKNRHGLTKQILEEQIGLDNVVLTIISKMELLSGAANKKEILQVNKSLTRFNLILLNENISRRALDLLLNFRCSHGLKLPDSLIAASVLEFEWKFFTYNKKDFRFIPELKLFETS